MPVIFDESRVSALALAWQQTEDAEGKARLWAEIVAESRNLLLSIICSYKRPLDTGGTREEILSELTLRLHRLLRYFKPAKGKVYSFLVRCSLNYLSTLRDRAWRYTSRYTVADLSSWDAHTALTVEHKVYSRPFEIREALDHYSRPDSDFEFFLTRNLVLYAYQREGRREPPTPGGNHQCCR